MSNEHLRIFMEDTKETTNQLDNNVKTKIENRKIEVVKDKQNKQEKISPNTGTIPYNFRQLFQYAGTTYHDFDAKIRRLTYDEILRINRTDHEQMLKRFEKKHGEKHMRKAIERTVRRDNEKFIYKLLNNIKQFLSAK